MSGVELIGHDILVNIFGDSEEDTWDHNAKLLMLIKHYLYRKLKCKAHFVSYGQTDWVRMNSGPQCDYTSFKNVPIKLSL